MPARPGRLDGILRAGGLLVWLVVGGPSWMLLPRTPEQVGSGHPLAWNLLYVGFAFAFWGATAPEARLSQRRALLAVQTLLALGLAILGMPHFEGALFALVAVQAPSLVSVPLSAAWDVAQGAALFPVVLPSHGWLGASKATAEYLAFALFALAVVVLREREAVARRELARAHSTLLATQSLLADDARTDERLRIAREVHDAIGHGLSAASIHLQIASRTTDAGAADAVAAAREAVGATLADVRSLVGAMRDEATVDLGTALRALCAGIRDPEVHLTLPGALHVAHSGTAHAMFRCVQEALTNAIRHAHARGVWIDVASDDRGVTATVRDDGVGAEAVTFGNGLEGLRERLGELGGSLDVEARPNAGFSLRACVPGVPARAERR